MKSFNDFAWLQLDSKTRRCHCCKPPPNCEQNFTKKISLFITSKFKSLQRLRVFVRTKENDTKDVNKLIFDFIFHLSSNPTHRTITSMELEEHQTPNLKFFLFEDSEEIIQEEEFKRTEKAISSKMEFALRLYGAGLTLTEAASRANVSISQLWKRSHTPEGIKIFDEVRRDMDLELQSLGKHVVTVLRKAVTSPSPQIALAGAKLWIQATKDTKIKIELSAEDIVKELLNVQHP